MRTITTHHTNEANKKIELTVIEDAAGQPYHYTAMWDEPPKRGMEVELPFQHGPIAEVGVNGITNEVLLAIVADRLEYFQRGPFACVENGLALEAVKLAAAQLELRTRAREARGVEGTHTP